MISKDKIPQRNLPYVRREVFIDKLNAMSEDVTQLYEFMDEFVDLINKELEERDNKIKQLQGTINQMKNK